MNRAARTMSVAGMAVIGGLCVAGVLMAGTTVAQLQSPVRRAGTRAGGARNCTPIVCGAGVAHIARPAIARGLSLSVLPAWEAPAPRRRSRESAKEGNSGSNQRGSYIEGLQSAGLKDLTVDEIIALKIHGVTPDYIRELRAAGIEASNPEFVALKIHEVTPEYVRGLAAAGLTNLQVRDYLAAKIQGITPEFIQGIRSHGFKDLTLRQLIALKMADIS